MQTEKPLTAYESWMWKSPGAIIERLIAKNAPKNARKNIKLKRRPTRDRYYTKARQLRLQKLMRDNDR